jgi:uncharacterized NAD(P)/FAD-binding protein YdhS
MNTMHQPALRSYRSAIIGAGFSGTLAAVQLLNPSNRPLTVYLIERDPHQFARGVAYSTEQGCHLLNVQLQT